MAREQFDRRRYTRRDVVTLSVGISSLEIFGALADVRRRLPSPGEISMESIRVGSLGFHFSRLGLVEKGQSCGLLVKGTFRIPARVRCGLRDAGPRGQLWRSRVLSSEAIQAVQALKLAKSSTPSSSLSQPPSSRKLEDVFDRRIGRLLKADMLAVLAELQRQNEWELALQVSSCSHDSPLPFFR